MVKKFIKNFIDKTIGKKSFFALASNIASIQKDISELKRYFHIENVVDFSSKNNVLTYGFHPQENWGCWFNKFAEVYLKVIQPDKDIKLDLYFTAFMPEDEKILQIFAGDSLMKTISSLDKDYHVTLVIPISMLNSDLLTLSFVSSKTTSPGELGIGADTRELGFGITKIVSDTPVITYSLNYNLSDFSNIINCCFNNDIWSDYIKEHDVPKLLSDLKKNVENSALADLLYERRKKSFSWTPEEKFARKNILQVDLSKYNIADKTGFQPEVFYYKNGLSFLDESIVKRHLEKGCVIDGGACTGDSALMFAEYDFVNKIYSFEPCHKPYLNLKNTLEVNNCTKAEAINMGLGGQDCETDILDEKCKVTTIDTFAKDKKVGCIKLDIEGLELESIKGAIETIKRDTPLLLICLYHTPKDFFEIKPLLESLNLGYKFKVADTEPCNIYIGVHLVLIAYKDEEI